MLYVFVWSWYTISYLCLFLTIYSFVNNINSTISLKLPLCFMYSVDSPMPAGHYMSNNTMLKIKVELANPLVTPEGVAAKEHIETTKEVYPRLNIYILLWVNIEGKPRITFILYLKKIILICYFIKIWYLSVKRNCKKNILERNLYISDKVLS